MSESGKPSDAVEEELTSGTVGPLVFISHDSRDADLAEAFSKLLKSVSAGMIKTFRSSDRTGTEGIDFGDEWYRRLMAKLHSTSDVVCLFTERSLDRPWILHEAGVAKGKLNTPVVGVALGVPLNRVSAGPFYQFQNTDDSESGLTKLVHQLAKRVPGLELDADVVKAQEQAFKATEAEILKTRTSSEIKKPSPTESEESSVAKLVEEMKTLPARVAERLVDAVEVPRRRRVRRFHPGMMEDLVRNAGDFGDPVAILMAAGFFRDDLPWMYELAVDAYTALKSEKVELLQREIRRLHKVVDVYMRGPFVDEFVRDDKMAFMLVMEFPRVLEQALRHGLSAKKANIRKKLGKQAERMPTGETT